MFVRGSTFLFLSRPFPSLSLSPLALPFSFAFPPHIFPPPNLAKWMGSAVSYPGVVRHGAPAANAFWALKTHIMATFLDIMWNANDSVDLSSETKFPSFWGQERIEPADPTALQYGRPASRGFGVVVVKLPSISEISVPVFL